MKILKKMQFLIPLIVIGLAILFVSLRTKNFEAFTSYSYAMVDAQPMGKTMPDDLYVQTKDNTSILLKEEVKGKYSVISLIFLKCPMVCPIITGRMNSIYQLLELDMINTINSLSHNLQFYSISFDRQRDNLQEMQEFKEIFFPEDTLEAPFKAGDNWTFAVLHHEDNSFIETKLAEFGFWMFEATPGMYNHSPYIFLLNPRGEIIEIMDPGKLTDLDMATHIKESINENK